MTQEGRHGADAPKVSPLSSRVPEDSAPAGPLMQLLAQTRSTRTLVEELIAAPAALGPDFTAIRRLEDSGPLSSGHLLGWKATGRGKPGTSVADTLTLLAEARRLGLVERLDWSFRCHTFALALTADLRTELHLTPEPETFGTPCPPRLAVTFLRGRRALSVCAELHDDAFEDSARLRQAINQMRDWGWQSVLTDLDDTNAALALRDLEWLRPAYIHIDTGRHNDLSDLHKSAVAAGAGLIAVNVNTPEAVEVARHVGATWVRGTLVGRPASTPE